MYVVCELSATIHVFDAKTHAPLKDINVANLRDPNDIAACSVTRQLCIADCRTDDTDSVGCVDGAT